MLDGWVRGMLMYDNFLSSPLDACCRDTYVRVEVYKGHLRWGSTVQECKGPS